MGTEGKDSIPSQESLRVLAAQKEKEWREVQELRSKSLEAGLNKKQKDYDELYAKFMELKEDFKYNLRLLAERDAELKKYDSTFVECKKQLADKQAAISELKIKIDDFENAAAREAKSRDELSMHYQKRVREKQAELEQYRCTKDEEIHKERQDLGTFKRNLERQVRELEEELDIQRRELTAGFEEGMRRREHEFRVNADQMSATVLAHEMKVKLLGKELELVKATQESATTECGDAQDHQRELEKSLKQKEWELEDIRAMKDAKESDLLTKLQKAESHSKRIQEDFTRKHAELDRYAKEKEAALFKVKDAAKAREAELQGHLHDLQGKLDEDEVKTRQLEWSLQDLVKDKDDVIERLQEEINELQEKWDSQIVATSKSNVTRDLRMEALKENDFKLKSELEQRKEDIERYKRELSSAVEREAALERARAQLDLDWQRRYESVERDQYEKAEDLTKNLISARDKAESDLRERERELEHQEDLIKLLTRERNQALGTLKEHGLTITRDMQVSDEISQSDPELVSRLQHQNENLREVVTLMRSQMETLGQEIPADAKPTKKASVAEDYTKSLEQELHRLKSQYRKLEQKVADANAGGDVLIQDVTGRDVTGDNVSVKSHVQQLNNNIGTLRKEKVELTAQLRKQQARILHYEQMLEQLSKQPKEEKVRGDQLEYEVSAQARRHSAEQTSLKQRISDLELQLIEARKEADEYHRANIERNMEVTTLSNQISQMKMEMAEGNPSVNFGAQELMIQQLQDELERMRRQLLGDTRAMEQLSVEQPTRGLSTNQAVGELQGKLRQAVKHIQQLAKEKQQLIEMGNRLRALLKRNGITPPSAPKPPGPPQEPQVVLKSAVPSQLQQKIHSKLSELEQLQYQLTKKQLAMAPRDYGDYGHETPGPVDTSSTDIDIAGDSEDEEFQPQSILKHSSSRPSTAGSLAPSRPGTAKKLSPVPEHTIPTPRPRTAPHSDILKIEHDIPTRPTSSMSVPERRSASPTKDPGLMMSMSSIGGDSLQEIWKMLDDEGISPRPITPHTSNEGPFRGLQFPGDAPSRGPSQPRAPAADPWALSGQTPAMAPRERPGSYHNLDPRIAGRVQPKKQTQPKSKIRNYNMRDDR